MLTSFIGSVVGAGSFNEGGAPPEPVASCALTGTLTESADEDGLYTGSLVLVATLTSEEWVPTIGADNSITTGFLDGLVSDGAETYGWDNQVALTHANVVRDANDHVLTITLPAYIVAITATETITLTIPADNLQYSSTPLVADNTFTIANVAETVALTGTCTDSVTESDFVAGGLTTILTVGGDILVLAAGSAFDNQRQNILDGFASDSAEGTDFIAEVVGNESTNSVVRTDDHTVTITWTAAAAHDITATETVTHTMPASALLASSAPIVATPTFAITHATVALSGTTVPSLTQAEAVTGGETTIITVSGDTLVANDGTFAAARQDVLDGFASDSAEATDFIAEVVGNESVDSVVYTDANTITITWSAAAAVDITATETVTFTMPASMLLASPSPIVASPTFTVTGNLLDNAFWWSTFDLGEQVQAGGTGATGFSGDNLSNASGALAESDPDNGADKITSAANYGSGLGGRGFRHKVADGSNDQGGGVALVFADVDAEKEFIAEWWIRFYLRYENGFIWSGGLPIYDKIIHLQATPAGFDSAIGWYSNPIGGESGRAHVAFSSGRHYESSLGWDTLFAGATPPSDGSWFCFEAYMKLNTVVDEVGQSDGVVATWINGAPAGRNDAATLVSTAVDAQGWKWIHIGGNQSSPDNSAAIMNVDYDDIVIYDTTPPNLDANAKAMIGPKGWENP